MENQEQVEQPITRREAERRLFEALLRLGVPFAEGMGLVCFDPETESAFWKFDRRSGVESIHVGPSVARLPLAALEMVLRHEFLHRSLYHGFHQRFRQPQLTNLVLDICINRLLFQAYPGSMKTMTRELYQPEALQGPVGLAACTARPGEFSNPQWGRLWRETWETLPGKGKPFLNPAALYFQLARLIGNSVSELLPEGVFQEGGLSPWRDIGHLDPIPTPRHHGALRKGVPSGNGGPGASRETDLELQDYSVIPLESIDDSIEQFLQRILVHRKLTDLATKITADYRKSVQTDPYPLYPSRLGYLFQALGYSELFHRFWNQHPAPCGAKLTVGLYLDVSPSMAHKFEVVSALARELADFAVVLRIFDTEVREADLDDLKQGLIQGTGGTDFNPPIQDFILDADLTAGVLFTDGMASVSDETTTMLQNSHKDLYVVYLLDPGDVPPPEGLQPFARQTLNIEIQPSDRRHLRRRMVHG